MKRMPLRIARHAATMVSRNLRSYALLSVTIVLSFSLLLGYLLWTDSSHYNRYKETFSQDRNIVVVAADMFQNPATAEMIKKKAAEYGNTHSMQLDKAQFQNISIANSRPELEERTILGEIPLYAIFAPAHAWSLYFKPGTPLEVNWLDGKEHPDYHLSSGEILLDDRLYTLFGLAEKDNRFQLRMIYEDDVGNRVYRKAFSGTYQVVGTIVSGEPLRLEERKIDTASYDTSLDFTYEKQPPTMVFSGEEINRITHPDLDWGRPTIVFYSTEPESVETFIRSIVTSDYGIFSVYQKYNSALETIRAEIGTKSVITAALLVILGINLYSSFSNALNDRRFEIGVKRAVGASKWSIIRQFLYESLLVMLSNILMSVWLVTTAGLVYKVIYEHIPHWGEYLTFTLTISPYSIGMFAACSLTLTVVFSLIFAYRATQVQIVDYLKAE